MKTTELNASLREETGKRVTKALRKAGKIPGVIYDNSAVKHIYVDAKEARKIVYTPDTHIVKLNVDGEVVDTIVREMQFHPVKEYVEHIDFLRVTDERPVEVVLPVRLIGV
ncbi:MAG: 50S ribosomal protein L25, partial [Bacteroidetes bacterium]